VAAGAMSLGTDYLSPTEFIGSYFLETAFIPEEPREIGDTIWAGELMPCSLTKHWNYK
jgi:hypothetical protein